MVNLEGQRKMIHPSLSTEQTTQLRNVIIGYVIWILASAISYYYILPDNWKWLAYGPVVFIFLAFIITGLVIITRPIMPKPIECVYVNHKQVTCCQFCSMAEVKDNIVNNSFPVVTCRETAKTCYQPMKIPRWCPYAK